MKKNQAYFLTALICSLGFLAPVSAAEKTGDQILAGTNWQGTTVKTKEGKDVTALNKNFIGLAKYDDVNNQYEFFDKQTLKSRDDLGVFFVTQDKKKRVLISSTKNYNAVVDLTSLTPELFAYERIGKVGEKTDGPVLVNHVPYAGKLEFTKAPGALTASTGKIITGRSGRDILSSTFWQGTVALDSSGKDVSASNQGFLGLSRYDSLTNKYEFFDKQTGASRGDYGYFDVIRDNKMRVHVSVGKKYAAMLELTELNGEKFTYLRKGKDASGNEIDVFVEHIPYKGSFPLNFTF